MYVRTSVRFLPKLCVDSFFVVHRNQTIESGDSKDALIRGYWFFEEINKRFFFLIQHLSRIVTASYNVHSFLFTWIPFSNV